MNRTCKIGMVHGRFQPFHIGHLQYVLKALELSEQLIIGITNPEPSELIYEVTSEHRHKSDSNPFNYFQRMEMIKRSLEYENVQLKKVMFIPFHLFDINKWSCYLPVPQNVTQHVNIFSEWEKKKIRMFIDEGFQVNIIDKNALKPVTGTIIRSKILTGQKWKEFVPQGTYEVIRNQPITRGHSQLAVQSY